MASLHNVTFMVNLIKEIRQAIIEKRFNSFKAEFLGRYLSEKEIIY